MPKTYFTATSPFTGEIATRESARAYTHAAWSLKTTEQLVAGELAEAARLDGEASRCDEIARHLAAGTEPQPGSVLLQKARSYSGASHAAGVKTEWDDVLYTAGLGRFAAYARSWSHEYNHEKYSWYAADARARAAAARARAESILAEGSVTESCTFHHSLQLAQKALATDPTHQGKARQAVVEAAVGEKPSRRAKKSA